MQNKTANREQNDFSRMYCCDIFLPSMVYGALVRSPKKRGQIRSITLPRLPDGYAYFSAKDIIGKNSITVNGFEISIFAQGETSFEGEPVGIITGPDENLVYALRDETEVEIDEQPPLLFSPQSENRSAERTALFGDPAGDFGGTVYQNSFLMQQRNLPDETYAVLADFSSQRELFLGIHLPAALRNSLRAALGLAKDTLKIHKTLSNRETLNSAMQYALLAAQAGTAALALKKPVKLVLSRHEQTRYYNNDSVPVIRHRTEVSAEGNLLCMQVSLFLDAGICSPYIQTVLDRLVIAACGIYTPQNARIEAVAIQTNNAPADFSLYYADYQAFFAVETQMRHIAGELGMDPIELRKKNMFPPAQKTNTFFCLHDAHHLEKVIDTLVDDCDYRRKHTAFSLLRPTQTDSIVPLRGMGLACAFSGSGCFNTAELKNGIALEALLDKNGTLTFFMPEPPVIVKNTVLPFIRETLGTDVVNIVFSFDGNTESIKPAHYFVSSTGIGIQLIEKVCTTLKTLRAENPLPLRVKKKFTVAGKLIWNADSFSGRPYVSTAWGAAAAEVEIDASVFEAVLRNLWIQVDAGAVRNEKNAAAILRRAIERITGRLGIRKDAALRPHISFIKSENDFKEFAAVADAVLPAAIINAVSQAAGQRITAAPLDAKTLYAALTIQKRPAE